MPGSIYSPSAARNDSAPRRLGPARSTSVTPGSSLSRVGEWRISAGSDYPELNRYYGDARNSDPLIDAIVEKVRERNGLTCASGASVMVSCRSDRRTQLRGGHARCRGRRSADSRTVTGR